MMWKKVFPHIPNLLSSIRIALVPVFVVMYFTDTDEVKTWALCVYIVAFITDALDGCIARRYNLTSNLGKVLDPLGDKLMMTAALTCMTISGRLPVWTVVIVVAKESAMGLGGLLIHRRAKVEIPPSNIFGKTATVVFVVACVIIMVFPSLPDIYATSLIALAIGLTFAALLSYVMTYRVVMKTKIDNKTNTPW